MIKMQNYKIKVANEAESKEAQELLFALGYSWGEYFGRSLQNLDHLALFTLDNGVLACVTRQELFDLKKDYQEITLPQLRDLVVLHRNDVGDATHDAVDGNKYYVGCEVYYWNSCNTWIVSNCLALGDVSTCLKPIKQEPQMTWQDALRAVADGKEVEAYSDLTLEWFSISSTTIGSIKDSQSKFRLAPQRRTLNGNFTKEELLKIAGEMG